jgi:type I restriction enzyme M protein
MPTGILIRSLPLAQPSAFPSRSLLPANSGLRARRSEPDWHNANVLFFDRKPAAEKPWTEKLWIHDLPPSSHYGATGRTNKHFTLKENPLKRSDLDDFVDCYLGRFNPDKSGANRFQRKESERFRSYSYEKLTKRDKLNLDIFWLKDESLEDSANLPDPDIIAQEIVEDLQAALAQFAEIASDLKK